MKKAFKFYAVIWTVFVILFNVISFVPAIWAGTEKYTPSFWIGYALITITLIGQIFCTYYALRDNNLKKTFYNISLATTSYIGLILSFIFGGVCMLVPLLPYWATGIICAIVLGLNVIAVAKASAVIGLVSKIDDKVKANTFFIRSLTVTVEGLVSRARSEAIKAKCKKVYDAVRYSDPMSNCALASVESEINIRLTSFSTAVARDDFEAVDAIANELIILLNDRDLKCKLLK